MTEALNRERQHARYEKAVLAQPVIDAKTADETHHAKRIAPARKDAPARETAPAREAAPAADTSAGGSERAKHEVGVEGNCNRTVSALASREDHVKSRGARAGGMRAQRRVAATGCAVACFAAGGEARRGVRWAGVGFAVCLYTCWPRGQFIKAKPRECS